MTLSLFLGLFLSAAPLQAKAVAPHPSPPSPAIPNTTGLDPARAFSLANTDYDKGDYEGAVSLYSELAEAYPEEPAYQYDLGNSWLKSGRTGLAVVSYLRAFRLAPRSSDIRDNLAFALGRAGEEFVPAGIPQSLFFLALALSRQELAGLFWLGIWVSCLFAGLYLVEFRPRWLRPALGFSLAFLVSFGGWLWLLSTLEPAELGVVLRSDAEVRSGPGANFPVAYTLPEGRRLALLGGKGDWREIAVPREGIKGWMLKESLEQVSHDR
jgi:tetratricopeptide (TPR) repeat protein